MTESLQLLRKIKWIKNILLFPKKKKEKNENIERFGKQKNNRMTLEIEICHSK